MNGMSTTIKDDICQNELLTVKEVAGYLRVSRVTVWRWCQQGVIPASQVGRNWRIHRDDLLHLLAPAQHPHKPTSVQHCSTPQLTNKPAQLPPFFLTQNQSTGCVEDEPTTNAPQKL